MIQINFVQRFAKQHLELAIQAMDKLDEDERIFVEQMRKRDANGSLGSISQRQFNWLKDIHDAVKHNQWVIL